MSVEAWSYPIAPLPPTPPWWQVAQATAAPVPVTVLGCGKLAIPACVVAVLAGGRGIANPPTEMNCGVPPPPSQFGAEVVPVPGQEWQELQSWVPAALVNAE